MNTMASALDQAGVVTAVKNDKREKKMARRRDKSTVVKTVDVPVTPESTLTLTESELRQIMSEVARQAIGEVMAQPFVPVTPVQAGPRQATKPETCAAHKFLSVLDQGLSKVIVGTRDHVIVPMNIWTVDKAAPQGLAVVAAGSVIAASGAKKISSYFARLAESAAAKSLALRVQ